MLKVTAILKSLETEKYYLIVSSENGNLACEVKKRIAEELLENNMHREKELDLKNQLMEWEFTDDETSG